MFLELAHTKLNIFRFSRALTLESYKLTKLFPQDEKFAMTQQIRRASLSVHLNIAEGCSRKSLQERKRFFEISRGSVIEVDTAFEIACQLSYITQEELVIIGDLIINTFKLTCGLISKCETHN